VLTSSPGSGANDGAVAADPTTAATSPTQVESLLVAAVVVGTLVVTGVAADVVEDATDVGEATDVVEEATDVVGEAASSSDPQAATPASRAPRRATVPTWGARGVRTPVDVVRVVVLAVIWPPIKGRIGEGPQTFESRSPGRPVSATRSLDSHAGTFDVDVGDAPRATGRAAAAPCRR
jgi:hypothetical protein